MSWKRVTGDKPFLATEQAIDDNKLQAIDSYRTAFGQALLYHTLLTQMDAVLIAYCWLLLDQEQPNFADTRTLFTVDRRNSFTAAPTIQRRALAAFARRLPQGMVRIGATSDETGLLAYAYQSPRSERTVILVKNRRGPRWRGWAAAVRGSGRSSAPAPPTTSSCGRSTQLSTYWSSRGRSSRCRTSRSAGPGDNVDAPRRARTR